VLGRPDAAAKPTPTSLLSMLLYVSERRPAGLPGDPRSNMKGAVSGALASGAYRDRTGDLRPTVWAPSSSSAESCSACSDSAHASASVPRSATSQFRCFDHPDPFRMDRLRHSSRRRDPPDQRLLDPGLNRIARIPGVAGQRRPASSSPRAMPAPRPLCFRSNADERRSPRRDRQPACIACMFFIMIASVLRISSAGLNITNSVPGSCFTGTWPGGA
jgi:hypothetical protein